MKIEKSIRRRTIQTALSAALVVAGLSAKASTTAPQVFTFGPSGLDFIESGSLQSFNIPGAVLLGVHVELSGLSSTMLFAGNLPMSTTGTVESMTESTAFSLAGLPSAGLSTQTATYSTGSFVLTAGATQSFVNVAPAPTVSVDLIFPVDLSVYDYASTMQSLIPFQFIADETFAFTKHGGNIYAGAGGTATGSATVYYTYETTPPPPVPEVSTAVSAGAFALMGAVFILRSRRTQPNV